MTALLMLAALAGGTAAALGAGAAERALRLWQRPARGAWAVALGLTLLLPVGAPIAARLASVAVAARAAASAERARSAPDGMRILPAVVVRAAGAPDRALQLARDVAARSDRPLALLWIATSALALLALGGGVRTLRRAARGWTDDVVDGVPVAIAPDLGPAVLGVTRPRIVLPTWTLALERPLRALVLRHEVEHARAGDPALLMAGALLVAAMPWNPAAWWIARRLRAAIEIDCDARVLRAHPDVTRYGLLLLAVAQRRDQARVALPALAALSALAPAPTDLERRIATMRARPVGGRARLARTLALGTGAATATIAALLACAAPDMVAGRPRDDAADMAAARAREDSVAFALRSADRGVDSLMIGLTPTFRALGDGARRDTSVRRLPVGARVPPISPMPPLASNDRLPNAERPNAVRPDEATAPQELAAGEAYFEFQVESPVKPMPGVRGPRYPDAARAQGREGAVLAQFVVDTTGAVEPSSFEVLQTWGGPEFVEAVRSALPTLRFAPALVGGMKVRQVVQQPFQFALSRQR
ncbi:MAG: TonB family protein [Gemmatirosa sp.]